MITLTQYVGPHEKSTDWNDTRQANAANMLVACSKLEMLAKADGVKFLDNPATGNGISGSTFGGFRPQNCKQGAPTSSHKEGLAVDRYDPDGKIDEWCMANLDRLETCGIYLEHPDATLHWSHWSTRAPKSGRRVFYP